MAQDVTKIYDGVIEEVGLTSSTVNSGAELLTGIVAGNLKITATPVTQKNSQQESLIFAYDLEFEAHLMQVKDFQNITPYNNQITTVKFHNTGGDNIPTLANIRVNVGIDGDFSDVGKAIITLKGTKRIETSDLANYISFATS